MDNRTRYDTSEVPLAERFAYWQDAVCDTYVRLGCDANERLSFSGSIDIMRHSMLSISRVGGDAHCVRRRNRDIRHATDDYFLLSLQLTESSRVSQFGKSAWLNPGDMTAYSSSDPYELQLTDNFSQIVIQLPKDRLLARFPAAELMTARKIDGNSGIGRLVRENILAFSRHVDAPNLAMRALVQETLIDLIATGIASTEGHSDVDLSSPEQQVMLRAKQFIRDNLGNSGLDRTMVSRNVGLSVRRLNAIFSKHGTSLSVAIRRARLDAIAGELTDPRFSCLSISEIACKYGFENFQYFSSAFRSSFGMSPREYRNRR